MKFDEVMYPKRRYHKRRRIQKRHDKRNERKFKIYFNRIRDMGPARTYLILREWGAYD